VSNRSVNIDVHGSVADFARDVIEAWHRAERGDLAERHRLSFSSWEQMAATLTPARLALLHHLRRNPAPSIAALARALGRDYKRVHEDVEALVTAGLVERDKGGVRTEYDEIRALITV
jgi:predicted transcriptional regulator